MVSGEIRLVMDGMFTEYGEGDAKLKSAEPRT